MPALRVLLVLTLLTCSTGCKTLVQGLLSGDGPAVFGGLRFIASEVDEVGDHPGDLILFGVYCLVDGPLCLAADLFLLPLSIPWEIQAGGLEVGWERISLP